MYEWRIIVMSWVWKVKGNCDNQNILNLKALAETKEKQYLEMWAVLEEQMEVVGKMEEHQDKALMYQDHIDEGY